MKEEREDKRLMDYLLGNLPEPEQVRLEEEYLADPSVQDHLLILEDELVDAYVEGRLPALDQKSLEARFLSTPRGCRKLELARSLKALAAEVRDNHSHSAPIKRPFPFFASIRWAFAVPATLLLLVLVWSIWTNVLRHPGSGDAVPKNAGSGNKQMNRRTATATETQAHNASTPPPVPIPTTSPSSGSSVSTVAFVTLRPAIRGIEQPQRVEIDRGTLQLRITLGLPVDSDGHYQVVLFDPNDKMKWKHDGLKTKATPSKKVIVLQLPTDLFDNGEYTLVVSSETEPMGPIAEYPFLVYMK